MPAHSAGGNCAASCTDRNATICARSRWARGMRALILSRSASVDMRPSFGSGFARCWWPASARSAVPGVLQRVDELFGLGRLRRAIGLGDQGRTLVRGTVEEDDRPEAVLPAHADAGLE